jgi:FkbM family methyltransferase
MSKVGAGKKPVKIHPSGWWIAETDTYFPQFLAGLPGKRNGFMREHLQEAFKYVTKWDVAVDVGAHVGFWSFDMAQRFREVHAFEAAACNYYCLVENVAEFVNVRTYNMAVGNRLGRCKTYADAVRPGNSGSLYVQPDPHGDIPMVALDEQNLPGCDFLKIDVEGFELKVLEGARNLIKKHSPIIIMECSDRKFIGRYDIPENEAQRWLRKHAYREALWMRPDKLFVPA